MKSDFTLKTPYLTHFTFVVVHPTHATSFPISTYVAFHIRTKIHILLMCGRSVKSSLTRLSFMGGWSLPVHSPFLRTVSFGMRSTLLYTVTHRSDIK